MDLWISVRLSMRPNTAHNNAYSSIMTSLKNKVTTTDGTEITPDHFGYKGHSSEGNHKKFLLVICQSLCASMNSGPWPRAGNQARG